MLFSKKRSFSQDKLRLFCIVILPSFRKVVKETDYYAECYPSPSPPLHSSFLLTGLRDAFTMSVGAREREACSRLHSKQHHLKGGTKTVVEGREGAQWFGNVMLHRPFHFQSILILLVFEACPLWVGRTWRVRPWSVNTDLPKFWRYK